MDKNWSDKRVPPEGPVDAKIVLIGEAPDKNEEAEGRPFVGGAGKVLEGVLAEVGLSREDVYITYVVKHKPKGNNFDYFYEDGRKRKQPSIFLQASLKELYMELENLNPSVIVPMGNEALKALTAKTSITKRRGSIYNSQWGKVIPTYHPAAVMRKWSWRPVMLFDFQKIIKESKTPEYNVEQRRCIVLPTYNEVMEYLNNLLQEGNPVAFDIETKTDQITCIGLSSSAHEAMCIPLWFGSSGSFYSTEQEVDIWMKLKELLEGPVPLIAQNGQFDMLFLWDQMGIECKNLYIDTMVAGHLCYPELPKGLDFLVSIYTNQPYYKDMIHTGRMDEYFRYNALDACCTYEVAMEVKKELEDLGLWEFYTTYVNKLVEPLMEMSKRGVRINQKLKREAIREYTRDIIAIQSTINVLAFQELRPNTKAKYVEDVETFRLKTIEKLKKIKTITPTNSKRILKYIRDLMGDKSYTLNVNSNKQMCDFLYKELGLKEQKRRRKGEEGYSKTTTADEEAISTLYASTKKEVLQEILHLREKKKILSTYLEAKVDRDGRMRTSYLITGTETGRLASNKYLRDIGTNFQNIPKGIARRIFVPDDGKVFLSADLSQAEARIVAYIAGEESLIRLFSQGRKIHREIATKIFRIPGDNISDEEWKKRYSHEYAIGKKLVHASNYGMGYNSFAKEAGVSVAEAKRLQNAYFAAYPGIKLRQLQVASQLSKSRMLTTPLGRKRLFMGTYNKDMLKDGYAYQPQSTVADLLNMGLLDVWNNLPPETEILLQVHDSILVQCPVNKVRETALLLEKHLTRTLDIIDINGRLRVCTVPCEFEIGYNWCDLEEYDPHGSRKWVDEKYVTK